MIGASEQDFEQLLDLLPFALPTLLVTILGVLFVLVKFAPALTISIHAVKGWTWIRRRLRRSADEQRAVRRRKMFADHVSSKIRDLDAREDWSDFRFAELEAEVEAVGRRRGFGRIFGGRRNGTENRRREKSLSKALARSGERLILLQGDPGSGKSVSLRHLARHLGERARTSNDPASKIPIYINLKRLKSDGRPIDAKLIESFVLETLAENATSDVDNFVDEQFTGGLEEGSWVFLFDSFDEIPEVLSSTDVDGAVRSYSQAIFGFMHGINRCRAIVASRTFRAPIGGNWPTFDILPLSGARKRLLIERAGLSAEQEDMVTAEVLGGDSPVAAMSSNPMFLGLLCEYVRGTGGLPHGTHVVFEEFVARRIRRDAERVRQRYGLEGQQVRRLAESVAFTMLWVEGLGLDPRRSALFKGLAMAGTPVTPAVSAALDALTYMKLAQAGDDRGDHDPTFTFVHRRFTEYFATCVVLQDPQRIPAHRLLTEGNWRETAVALLQTQETRGDVMEHAALLLANFAHVQEVTGDVWPPAAHHLLLILQLGFAGRRDELPGDVVEPATKLIVDAFGRGRIHDRKSALEVVGVVRDDQLEPLLRTAFRGTSDWLRDVAYRQTALLRKVPDDIAQEIRRTILRIFGEGRLRSQRATTRAELLRLPRPEPYIQLLRALRIVGPLDMLLVTIGIALLVPPWDMGWGRLLLWVGGTGAVVALTTFCFRVLAAAGGGAGLWVVLLPPVRAVLSRRTRTSSMRAAELALLGRSALPLGLGSVQSARLGAAAFIAVLYLTLWGPATLMYLVDHPRPRIAILPAAPLVLLIELVAGVRRIRSFRVAWADVRGMVGLAVGGGAFFLAVWAGSKIDWPEWMSVVPVLVLIFTGGLAVVGLVAIGPLPRVLDRRAARRFDAEDDLDEPIAFDYFLDLLAQRRSEDGQTHLIAYVRRRRRLRHSDENRVALDRLIDAVENKPAAETEDKDALGRRLEELVARDGLADSIANPRVLDELGRLAKTLQTEEGPVGETGSPATAPTPSRESPA
jgi:NACHT domain